MAQKPVLIDDKLTIPPWLDGPSADLGGMIGRGSAPQALLVHGPPGVGRRYLSLWFAAQLLGVPGGRFASLAEGEVGQEPPAELAHPDLMVIQPPPDKTVIPVESVRELIAFLQLRSHQGGARVAMIWPAENMMAAAANSLLKTLEEPPPGSAIILVAAVPARLTPTVLSRCHKLRLPAPARDVGLTWLREQGDAPDWGVVLDFAGGAPLQALALQRAGFAAQIARYADDLVQLRQRRESPAAVARKWASANLDLTARWLYLQAAASVENAMDMTGSGNRPLQKPVKPTNIPRLLERLSEAEMLYRDRLRSVGVEIQLTALLQRWYGETVIRDEN